MVRGRVETLLAICETRTTSHSRVTDPAMIASAAVKACIAFRQDVISVSEPYSNSPPSEEIAQRASAVFRSVKVFRSRSASDHSYLKCRKLTSRPPNAATRPQRVDRSRSKSWPVVVDIDDRDHDRPIGQR